MKFLMCYLEIEKIFVCAHLYIYTCIPILNSFHNFMPTTLTKSTVTHHGNNFVESVLPIT